MAFPYHGIRAVSPVIDGSMEPYWLCEDCAELRGIDPKKPETYTVLHNWEECDDVSCDECLCAL